MNALSAIANLYIMLTLTATAILLHTFWHRFDNSARYFLTAEVMMTISAGLVSMVNLYPGTIGLIVNAVTNFLLLASEVIVLLSIVSLYEKPNLKLAYYAIALLAIASLILETMRVYQLYFWVNAIYYTIFLSLTLLVSYHCFHVPNANLKGNRFLTWIGIFEFGISIFYIIRFIGNLASITIHHREATIASVSLISFVILCNVFRYISYIALRSSWVHPDFVQKNPLNEKLVNALEEKDRLLTGLMASNRVIGISALASSLAHQLSQPLTAIALQAGALKISLSKHVEKNQTFEEAINEICHQSENLSELVRNLRQLFNTQVFNFQAFNLQEVIEQILEISVPTLAKANINVKTSFSSVPPVYGDKIQIQQVLINLIHNAADAIAANLTSDRVISIAIEKKEGFAAFTVTDSGTGISDDILPNIFDLYHSTKKEGLGVGLWLCKTIVDRHHGSINVISNTSFGACFEVQIPFI